MYAKGKMYVNFFHDEVREDSAKVRYGKVSESFKVTDKKGNPVLQDGKQVYNYETWSVRFVGKAKDKMDNDSLSDGQTIILTEWSCRNPYNEEKKRTFPYILVLDFEYVNK